MDGSITGVVLVGGSSRRMGVDKALLPVDGVPMVRRVVDALLGGGCDRVVLVGHERVDPAVAGLIVHPDDHPGQGPLGGVCTALHRLEGDLVIVACDLPDLDATTVRRIAWAGARPDVDVAVARTADDRRHPTCARWNHSAAPTVDAAFTAGRRSLHEVLALLRVLDVAVDDLALRNVNLPSDLDGR